MFGRSSSTVCFSSLTLCSKEQGRAGSPRLARKLGLVLQASCPGWWNEQSSARSSSGFADPSRGPPVGVSAEGAKGGRKPLPLEGQFCLGETGAVQENVGVGNKRFVWFVERDGGMNRGNFSVAV